MWMDRKDVTYTIDGGRKSGITDALRKPCGNRSQFLLNDETGRP